MFTLLSDDILEFHIAKYCFQEFRILNKKCLKLSNIWHPIHKESNKTLINYEQEINKGNVLLIQNLIDWGYLDINKDILSSYYTGSLLHYACKCKEFSFISFLIEHGSNISNQDTNKQTSLHIACLCCSLEIVKLLVENGADINIRDREDRTCIFYACMSGSLEIVKYLVNSGAEFNISDNIGQTPLIVSCLSNKIDILKYFVEDLGQDIEKGDNKGINPLHWANWYVLIDIVKYLIDRKANIKAIDEAGQTALHYACWNDGFDLPKTLAHDRLDIVKIIVSQGIDINVVDNSKNTPLHLACCENGVEIVKFLLSKGADPSLKNNLGMTPYACAVDYGNKLIIDFLESNLINS